MTRLPHSTLPAQAQNANACAAATNTIGNFEYSLCEHADSKARTCVVPAGHGHAFTVRKDEHFRIVDLYGQQVVDFAAWVRPDMTEKLSMAYTRFHLSGATPRVGECLMTNKDDPLFLLVEDTVKVHGMFSLPAKTV